MANVSEDDYTTYTEYKAGILIWKIVPPVLILLGTVGNGLSILVLTRRCIRSSTTALYLTVLAFSDLLVLYSGLLRQWLRFLFETDVRHVSEFGCKLNIWLVYCSLDFSAWILLLVTLERVISAWLPHNAKTLCTKKSAIALLISVAVTILCLNSHLLYGMVFKYIDDGAGNQVLEKCVEIDEDYSNFFNVTWPWIDLCAFCVIPFAVIVIGNGLILFKVIKSQKKVKSRVVPSVQCGSRQQITTNRGHKQSSMTAMLFTLNIVFLFSTSPISIYNVGYTHWEKDATGHEYAQLDMWWAVVNMLMYVNNSLNFLLYCLSGTKFRREVIRIFTSWKRGVHNDIQMAHSNYTRTKFETPSPALTPRHSIFILNSQSPHPKPKADINGQPNGFEHQNDENQCCHSNNSLHPNDALRGLTSMSSFKGVNVKKLETTQSDSAEISETIMLDNAACNAGVESQKDSICNGDNKEEFKPEQTEENVNNSTAVNRKMTETEIDNETKTSNLAVNKTKEISKSDNTRGNTITVKNNVDTQKDSHSHSLQTVAVDSTA